METWNNFAIDSAANPETWQSQVLDFLSVYKPQFGGVVAGISAGEDVNIWARKDGNGPAWSIQHLVPANQASWSNDIMNLFQKERVVIIGFHASDPPGLWYLQAA